MDRFYVKGSECVHRPSGARQVHDEDATAHIYTSPSAIAEEKNVSLASLDFYFPANLLGGACVLLGRYGC